MQIIEIMLTIILQVITADERISLPVHRLMFLCVITEFTESLRVEVAAPRLQNHPFQTLQEKILPTVLQEEAQVFVETSQLQLESRVQLEFTD